MFNSNSNITSFIYIVNLSLFPFKNTSFSKVKSDNLFLVGLLINPAMENNRSTGAEEHKLVLNLIKRFFYNWIIV